MDYRYRDGYRSRGVPAADAYAELERLRAESAERALTASAVFEAARPAAAVLHDEFEWNGAKAVEELGMLRARNLIRAVVVIHEKPAQAAPRQVYVHVPSTTPAQPEGNYQPVSVVVRQPDAYARALLALQAKFDAAQRALAELRAAAHEGAPPERLAAIAMAVEAFATARQALAAMDAA